jgi:hypothetical protein
VVAAARPRLSRGCVVTMHRKAALRRTAAIAVALFAALVVGGCGDDDGSSVRDEAPTQAPGSDVTKDTGNGY